MSSGQAAPDTGGARSGTGETGPGIIETSIVLGVSLGLALVLIVLFGGQLADMIGVVVDAAHGSP